MSSTRPPEFRRAPSITARLVAFYLVSTLLILLCTNWFQFKALSKDLDYEDNDFVLERINSLRDIVARHPDALRDQVPVDKPGQPARHLIRIQDAEGHTLLQSPQMSALTLGLFPPAVTADEKIGRSIKYRTPDHRHYLLNSAWAGRGGDPHFRLVQVALDITDEDALMSKYLLRTSTAVAIGLLLAAGLGVVITRRGLKPLQEMAGKLAQINEAGLHQRVRSAAVWPQELDQLTAALDAMLARLEESFARLSEFSANLAHELRTPINNLRGEAEVALSRARSEEEYRHIIESSIEEYERLARMVGDILFLARPDRPREARLIDARQALETLAEYYSNVAEEQQTSITVEGEGSVCVDPNLFQRAVGNLISNALHYTPKPGRISLKIEPELDGSVAVAVADNGMGVEESELPRVFDRFYRSPQARLVYNQGSGLGLAIVRSIMTLHGGSVSVASTPGAGTTVMLRFPPLAPDPPDSPATGKS
ncbi:heavy metal sensor signal transduction histidine kinase [Citrifermentans bremense]|uniref:histidine kinase n=1 Tax=Citrifermentans bremense TaxID=60035 RepID=A0A6S6MB06_9BACT|nr:heavy metal sensor histidine kinase [Citrifermentans bremense]BCG48721.1 heavy metal sensor signal transduction histidine kinase [Citrifermentans bremense]